MRNDSASIQGAAFHEAGHVVGALAEGNRVVSVQVSRSNPGHGVAYIIYKKNKNPFGDGRVSLESAWRYALERQLGVVRSLLAGPLAEAKCTGKPMRSLGSESDFERCLRKIEELQPYHEYLCACGGDLTAFNPYEVLKQERKRVRSWLGEWTIVIALIIGAGWYFGVGPVDEFVDLTGFGACDRLAKDIASEFDKVLAINDAVAFERQPKGRYISAEHQFDSQEDAPVVKSVGEAVLPTGRTERVAIYKWRLDGPNADDGQVNEDHAVYYAVEPLTPGYL